MRGGARRPPPHPRLAPHALLPADTRLWAALQRASGGTWAGCVYDVDRIIDGARRQVDVLAASEVVCMKLATALCLAVLVHVGRVRAGAAARGGRVRHWREYARPRSLPAPTTTLASLQVDVVTARAPMTSHSALTSRATRKS